MKHAIVELLQRTGRLKARQIAKHIGEERKLVSSFLHDNIDLFNQDSGYRWSLVNNSEIVIELENAWVDDKSFEKSLKKASSRLRSDYKNIRVIIPKGCNILLIVAARLLMFINQQIYEGKNVAIDLTECRNTLGFLNRIGFFDQLHRKTIILPEWPVFHASEVFKGQSKTTVEFGTINPGVENKHLVNQLTERFVDLAHENYEVAAFTIFSELTVNVKEHSQSPIAGFAALQKYRGHRAHIQTVVSDGGLGIAQTLRSTLEEHHPDLHQKYHAPTIENDIELVTEALLYGGISRLGSGRGLGFKSSRENAMKFEAKLTARQETFCIEFEYEGGKIACINKTTDLVRIKGTSICFDFYID